MNIIWLSLSFTRSVLRVSVCAYLCDDGAKSMPNFCIQSVYLFALRLVDAMQKGSTINKYQGNLYGNIWRVINVVSMMIKTYEQPRDVFDLDLFLLFGHRHRHHLVVVTDILFLRLIHVITSITSISLTFNCIASIQFIECVCHFNKNKIEREREKKQCCMPPFSKANIGYLSIPQYVLHFSL